MRHGSVDYGTCVSTNFVVLVSPFVQSFLTLFSNVFLFKLSPGSAKELTTT